MKKGPWAERAFLLQGNLQLFNSVTEHRERHCARASLSYPVSFETIRTAPHCGPFPAMAGNHFGYDPGRIRSDCDRLGHLLRNLVDGLIDKD
jgi:hypothetical protein